MKKRKGWLLCRQPTVSAMGRNRCHMFVFSLTCHPHPVLAHKIRDSTNSCGIELNRKLPCGCEKIASIITEWHNWTRVPSNWTEGQEIQTDAKKHLAEEVWEAPVQALGWPNSQFQRGSRTRLEDWAAPHRAQLGLLLGSPRPPMASGPQPPTCSGSTEASDRQAVLGR